MQGIGVVQWQDDVSDYPLRNAGSLGGVFCDANFVTYNSFIPILTNISIIDSNLSISIQFDDAVQTFITPLTNAVQGNVFRLRTSSRTYGCVVFGRLIADVVAGVYGATINTNTSFEAITVRTINQSNGLYSINGLTGAVTLTLDDNMWFESNTFNAASIPDNIVPVNTLSTNLYLNTNEFGLIAVNPATNEFNFLITLDKPYTAICNIGSQFIGAYVGTGSGLYTINTIPSQSLVQDINPSNTSIALALDGGGNLWGLTSTDMLNFGPYAYTNTPLVCTTSVLPNAIFYFDGQFISCVNGSGNSMLYKMIPAGTSMINIVIGQILLAGLGTGLPPVISMASANSILYILCSTGTSFPIYAVNLTSMEATLAATYDGSYGSAVSIFMGGNEILLTPIVPLKTINSISVDSLNNIAISAEQITPGNYNTLKITSVSNNTLQFSLPIQDAELNVNRTTVYS